MKGHEDIRVWRTFLFFIIKSSFAKSSFFTLKKHVCDQAVSTDIAEMWS